MTLAILLLSRSGGPTHDASFFTPQYDFWRSVFTKMAFCQMLVSWNQSSFKKMQPMAAAEVALKSPLIPLFQRGNYSIAVLTPLWKRGEGEISTRRYGNYLTNFNSRTLVDDLIFFLSRQIPDKLLGTAMTIFPSLSPDYPSGRCNSLRKYSTASVRLDFSPHKQTCLKRTNFVRFTSIYSYLKRSLIIFFVLFSSIIMGTSMP